MNEIELRMSLIMKRNKPLKNDLKWILQERDFLKETNENYGFSFTDHEPLK